MLSKYSKHFDFQRYAIIPNLLKKTSEGDITIVGVLSFHGVEASKTVIAEYSSSNTGFRIQGSFNFNATDFGVSLPSFLLVKINETIAIDYDLLF